MTSKLTDRVPSLIQRLKVKTTDKKNIVGFDSAFTLDYMGSAEFEFGSVPKALREIVGVANDLRVYTGPEFKTRRVYLVCHRKEMADCMRMLELVCAPGFRAKEYVGIHQFLMGDEHRIKSEGWWDIDHCWMAFISKEYAELSVHAIKTLRDRWAREGKL